MGSLYFFSLILMIFLKVCGQSFADTLILSHGQEIKGLILEEYVDRVIVSTPEGEKVILKNEVAQILYDSKDQQLIQKGNELRAVGEYEQALSYYKNALQENPDSEQIKQLISSTRARLDGRLEQKAAKQVENRNTIFALSQMGLNRQQIREIRSFLEELRSQLGLSLKESDGKIKVGIRYGSIASKSGFQSGDLIVAMDGELLSYRSAEEVAQLLLGELERTIFQVGIERSIAIQRDDPTQSMGCQFSMEYEGLTIRDVSSGTLAQEKGLSAGDRVTAINGVSTRYLPLRECLKLIEQSIVSGSLTLAIQRQIWLMRQAK